MPYECENCSYEGVVRTGPCPSCRLSSPRRREVPSRIETTGRVEASNRAAQLYAAGCQGIEDMPHVEPGWSCCECFHLEGNGTYNAALRLTCKVCGHARCDPRGADRRQEILEPRRKTHD